jgi:hypothetical protein
MKLPHIQWVKVYRSKTFWAFILLGLFLLIFGWTRVNQHPDEALGTAAVPVKTPRAQDANTSAPPEELLAQPKLMEGGTRANPAQRQVITQIAPSGIGLQVRPLLGFFDAPQQKPSPPQEPEPTPDHSGLGWIPRGRKIPCMLVDTIDSSNAVVPITAVVTEDIYDRKGRLLIPRKSIIQATANSGHLRDRILVQGSWDIVFPDHLEYEFEGLALDKETSSDEEEVALTNGSAGIRGDIIYTEVGTEVKAALAASLSAFSQGLMGTQNTVYGTTYQGNAQNGGFNALSAIADRYINRLEKQINDEDATFVRVLAGKPFWVTPTTVLRPQQRSVGASGDQSIIGSQLPVNKPYKQSTAESLPGTGALEDYVSKRLEQIETQQRALQPVPQVATPQAPTTTQTAGEKP